MSAAVRSLLCALIVCAVAVCTGCTSSTSPESNPNFSADVKGVHWLPKSTVFGWRMNDLSGVGIAALLLALLPLVQTCFRMVRLRCSPANGARGDQQRRDAVLTAIAAPSANFQDFSQICRRVRTSAAF